MTKGGKPERPDSRFRGNDIWGAGSRFCGNDKKNSRGDRRRARRRSGRGGRAPRGQGETAQAARRQKPGRLCPARRQARRRKAAPKHAKGDKRRAAGQACRLPELRSETARACEAAKQDKARPSPGSAEAEGLWSSEGKQARPMHWPSKAPVSRAGEKTGGAGA